MQRWKRNQGILNFPKYCMIAMGMWRLNLPTRNRILTKLYTLYSCLIQIYYPVFWISLFIKFVIVLLDKNSNKSLEEWFKDLSYVVGLFIIVIAAQFWQKRNVVRSIYYVIEEEKVLLECRDEELLKCHFELAQFSRLTNYVLFSFALCIGMSVMSETFLRKAKIEKYNQRYNATLEKPFAFDLFFVINFDKEKFCILLLIVDGVSCFLSDLIGVSSKIMFISCIIFACSTLQRLQLKFRKMARYGTDFLITLYHLIEEHQKIIRFVHNFNRSMKYLILVEYLLTSLNIAAVSIQMILFNSTRASATFFLSYLFSQIFILGWSANEIKMQSLAISDAIYDSPWYYQNGNAKKAVLLIIMRAQRPLQLTIGPFDAMSTETAVTVVKGSYSYVTLMWTKYV
ncbi:odorant receptor 67c-like isoform X1 [Cylas formicarius]|uniref:odorant receptor 67c-like isoform X1 n=1 Tax=Cylas formicarius TaxID=197179 RepID=UPI00295854DF|nr:odorant receptor 67c-like isoform X1 [Cylas formicarius]